MLNYAPTLLAVGIDLDLPVEVVSISDGRELFVVNFFFTCVSSGVRVVCWTDFHISFCRPAICTTVQWKDML